MTPTKLFAAALVLGAVTAAPGLAEARHYRHHHHGYYIEHHVWRLPYRISYVHNYGPGPAPGTFAYYDGPSTVHCAQSAAAYLGQDRRRHPCF